MLSPQAKIIKTLLKATKSDKRYRTANVAHHRQRFERNVFRLFPSLPGRLKWTNIAGVRCAWIELPNAEDRTVVYVHGGGFVFGSPRTHQQHLVRLAKLCKAKILAIDYSLSPEAPYPIPLEEN